MIFTISLCSPTVQTIFIVLKSVPMWRQVTLSHALLFTQHPNLIAFFVRSYVHVAHTAMYTHTPLYVHHHTALLCTHTPYHHTLLYAHHHTLLYTPSHIATHTITRCYAHPTVCIPSDIAMHTITCCYAHHHTLLCTPSHVAMHTITHCYTRLHIAMHTPHCMHSITRCYTHHHTLLQQNASAWRCGSFEPYGVSDFVTLTPLLFKTSCRAIDLLVR